MNLELLDTSLLAASCPASGGCDPLRLAIRLAIRSLSRPPPRAFPRPPSPPLPTARSLARGMCESSGHGPGRRRHANSMQLPSLC